jgi:hypothetical protein
VRKLGEEERALRKAAGHPSPLPDPAGGSPAQSSS